MSYDNSPLLVERNESGFWARSEHIDQGKTVLGLWGVLFHSSVAVDLTGSVAETTMRSVTVPGGLLGLNGVLRVSAAWSYTGSVNAKTLRFKLGGTTFAQADNSATAANVTGAGRFILSNRGALNSQLGNPAFSMGLSYAGTQAFTTAAVDTSIDQVLTVTGQLASAPELLRLERLLIEVLPT